MWNFIVCGLKSERGKLKYDASLNWQPVEFAKCVDNKMTLCMLQFLLLRSGLSVNE